MADWPRAGRPIGKVRRTTALTAGAGGQYVPFDVEDIDTDNMVDLATNSDRITIRTPGIYIAHLVFRVDNTAGQLWIHGGVAGTTRVAATKFSVAVWGSLLTPPKQCAVGEFFRVFLDASIFLEGSGTAPDYSGHFAVYRLDG